MKTVESEAEFDKALQDAADQCVYSTHTSLVLILLLQAGGC